MKRFAWMASGAVGVVIIVAAVIHTSFGADAPPALTPQAPIVLQRAPGAFDSLQIDDRYRRLLVAHSGSRTLDVVDLNNNSVLRQEAVGEGHGIAVDVKDGKYFVGTSRQAFVVVLGRKFMVKDDQIPTGGPINAIALAGSRQLEATSSFFWHSVGVMARVSMPSSRRVATQVSPSQR